MMSQIVIVLFPLAVIVGLWTYFIWQMFWGKDSKARGGNGALC